MLDTIDRFNPKQISVVSFGANAGPHNIVLSDADSRLVVTDYFLNEDAAGIIHFEGDHKVHVLKDPSTRKGFPHLPAINRQEPTIEHILKTQAN